MTANYRVRVLRQHLRSGLGYRMTTTVKLQVLLVEDETEDLRAYERDFPKVFQNKNVEVDIHTCADFDEANELVSSPSRRFDLVVSDTYKGDHKNLDAAVLKMVEKHRQSRRFCPLVVYSSATKPAELKEGPFVVWADKGKDADIERAIESVLDTDIPQLARSMHDELDGTAGEYLWGFLEDNWNELQALDGSVLERLIRRRASVQFANLAYDGDSIQAIGEVEGLEFYIYPAIPQNGYCLGDLIRNKREHQEMGLILTPHCHVAVQPGQDSPRADHVLVARMRPFQEVLAEERGQLWKDDEEKRLDQLRRRTQSPAQIGNPRGRYFFLPGFMDIPDCYCDLMRLTSIQIDVLDKGYTRVATLVSPFAEAIQASLTRFYGAVGVPSIYQESIKRLINTPGP